MKADELDKTFEVLRELPVELTVEQVGGMVATFTLAPAAGSWFSHTLSRLGEINLNSILMTSAGALIIAGSVYLLSPNDQEPRTPRTQVPASIPVEERAATPPVEEQQTIVSSPPAPVPEAVPPIKEEAVLPPDVVDPSIAFVAPLPAIPPVRAITVIPARPGILLLQNCTLAVDPGMMATAMGSREFDLTGFSGVSVVGAMDVVLEQGPFSVAAEGDEKLIERLELMVKDKTLVIATKNEEDKEEEWSYDGSVVVKVVLPNLERLALTGSGDVVMGDFSGTGNLDMDLQGSGDIRFAALKGLASLSIDLDGSGDVVGERAEVSGKTKISVAGSGDIRISGHTEAMEVDVVGSGDVDAGELKAGECDAKVTGSGSVNVNCKAGIRSRITGSGSINNTGNADEDGTKGEGSHTN